jgi:hypothetical protein
MTIMNYLKTLIRRKSLSNPDLEYERDVRDPGPAIETRSIPSDGMAELDRDIDLSPHTDLENYARGLHVSKESIERWISSGLLMPEELKVAEKLVRIMRKI